MKRDRMSFCQAEAKPLTREQSRSVTDKRTDKEERSKTMDYVSLEEQYPRADREECCPRTSLGV